MQTRKDSRDPFESRTQIVDVVLFRSEDEVLPDRYVDAFQGHGMTASCVPVLDFRYPSQDRLQTVLSMRERFDGLVVTSPRALRAVRAVFQDEVIAGAWTGAPTYTVGSRTARLAASIGLDPRGEASGSAADLAAFIVDEMRGEDESSIPLGTLLFLAGNRRRDVLPDALSGQGVAIQEMVVYETVTREDVDVPDDVTWLAFFSPSGVQAIDGLGVDLQAYRCAAIGDTTAAALDEAGAPADAVAETPGPEPLASAVATAF